MMAPSEPRTAYRYSRVFPLSGPRSRSCREKAELQLSSSLDCLCHGDFVRVFDVASGGDAGSDAGYLHAWAFDELGDVNRSSFAFDGGIGRDDDLVHFAGVDAMSEITESQMLRSYAVQRRK